MADGQDILKRTTVPDGQALLQKIWDTYGEIPSLSEAATVAENNYEVAAAEEFERVTRENPKATVELKKAMVAKLLRISDLWLQKERTASAAKYAQQGAYNVMPKLLDYYRSVMKNDREIADRLSGNRG